VSRISEAIPRKLYRRRTVKVNDCYFWWTSRRLLCDRLLASR